MKKSLVAMAVVANLVLMAGAEAGFTDDLRAKLAGKDFTMQYVQKYDFANPNIADVGDKFTFTRQGKNFAVKHDFAKYVKQGNVWKLSGYTNHRAYLESINALPNDYPYYDVRDSFMTSFYAEVNDWLYLLITGDNEGTVQNMKKVGMGNQNAPLMNYDCSTTLRIIILGDQKGNLPKPLIKNVQYENENLIVEEYEIPLVEQEDQRFGKMLFYYNPKYIKGIVKNSGQVMGVPIMKQTKQMVRMYYRADGSLAYFDAITSHPNGAKYRVDFLNYNADNTLFDYLRKFSFDKSKPVVHIKL